MRRRSRRRARRHRLAPGRPGRTAPGRHDADLAEQRIIGVCKLIKVGRLLATGEVLLYSEGLEEPVAHVVGSYAIPQQPPA